MLRLIVGFPISDDVDDALVNCDRSSNFNNRDALQGESGKVLVDSASHNSLL